MDASDRASSTHPTIVVGYGAFGRDVLRRVLLMTASRGALVYQEPRAGDDPSSKRLRDLALLHVDTSDRSAPDDDAVDGRAGAFELMSDLYRQIITLDASGGSPPAQAFSEAIREAASQLLSASDRTARRDRLRLGLDVIVVARPGKRDLGQIVEMLRPAMDELVQRPNLARSAQGADRINFVKILDFEHFWDDSPRANELRSVLRGALEQWEDRRRDGRATFRRVYLLDRHTEAGDRDDAFRVDEVALFLELMLFEGRRDKEQHLFQPRNNDESPLGAFGIRTFERSAGLMTRLAAARFGMAWLAHLAKPEPNRAVDLAEMLPEATPAALKERFRGKVLDALGSAEIARLERRLAEIPPSSDDYSGKTARALREGCDAFRAAVVEWMGTRSRAWIQDHLKTFRERLAVAVEDALHKREPVVPIVTLVDALDALARDVDPSGEALPVEGEVRVDDALQDLRSVAASYERFVADQVRTAELPRFWIGLSAVAAAAMTPRAVQVVLDAAPPDPTERFLTLAFGALRALANPIVAVIVFFVLFLAATLGGFQRTARRASQRALDFYVDPERGRFADATRRLLEKGQPLRASLDNIAQVLGRQAELAARTEVHREIKRVIGRLNERIRELSWARLQMGEFLKVHGIDPAAAGAPGPAQASLGPVRATSELATKLSSVLAANPITEQRFRDAQRSVRPFDGWGSRHESPLLLSPLRLLERLSADYRDPLEAELATRGSTKERDALMVDLAAFLTAQHDLSTGFLWSTRPDERTHSAEAICILPAAWRDLPNVEAALRGQALRREAAVFDGRAYVMKVQLGIPIEQVSEFP